MKILQEGKLPPRRNEFAGLVFTCPNCHVRAEIEDGDVVISHNLTYARCPTEGCKDLIVLKRG